MQPFVVRVCTLLLGAGSLTMLAPAVAGAATPTCTTQRWSDFSDVSALQVNGDAAVDGAHRLVLTPALGNQTGSVFTASKVTLRGGGSFSTHFVMQFGNAGTDGADGLVFVVQNVNNSVGGVGGGMGYDGLTNSVGVEFDDWSNSGDPGFTTTSEPSRSHVGVDLNGNIRTTSPVHDLLADGIDLDDGVARDVWIDYRGSTDALEVRLSADGTRPTDPLLATTIDLPTVLGSNAAYVGFTAGTGGIATEHRVNGWQLDNCYQPFGDATPPTVDAGPDSSGAEGTALALTGSVSSGATAQWSVAAGNDVDPGGTCTIANASAAATTATCTDDGTYTATLTGDTGVASPVTDTATLTVSNAAPTIAISAPAAAGEGVVPAGTPAAFSATITDPGANDAPTCSIDWGDGSTPSTGTVTSTTCASSHQYAEGNYVITATASDGDGGMTSDVRSISVQDIPGISIGDVSAPEASGTLSFPITLGSAANHDVTVHWATVTGGTATAGADYTAANGTATIVAGQTAATATADVPILDDLTDEADQTVVVTLDNPTGGVIADGSAMGTILDDDAAPTLSIDAHDPVRESLADKPVTYTARLARASEKPVSVVVHTPGVTATAGADFKPVTGPVTFAPGATTRPVTVTIKPDDHVEGPETFSIDLTDGTNKTALLATATETINDDERRSLGGNAVVKLVRRTVDRAGSAGPTVPLTISSGGQRSSPSLVVEQSAFRGPSGAPCDTVAARQAGCYVKIGAPARSSILLRATEPGPWAGTYAGQCRQDLNAFAFVTCTWTDVRTDRMAAGGTHADQVFVLHVTVTADPEMPPGHASSIKLKGDQVGHLVLADLLTSSGASCTDAAVRAGPCDLYVGLDASRPPFGNFSFSAGSVDPDVGFTAEGCESNARSYGHLITCNIHEHYLGP